jgi:hypothetical protein
MPSSRSAGSDADWDRRLHLAVDKTLRPNPPAGGRAMDLAAVDHDAGLA